MIRRNIKFKERTTPCNCCGYPVSQRHHLLEVAKYGESNYTRQLCANCHELYHIIDRASNENRLGPNALLLGLIENKLGPDHSTFKYLLDLLDLTYKAKKELENEKRIVKTTFDIFNYVFELE